MENWVFFLILAAAMLMWVFIIPIAAIAGIILLILGITKWSIVSFVVAGVALITWLWFYYLDTPLKEQTP